MRVSAAAHHALAAVLAAERFPDPFVVADLEVGDDRVDLGLGARRVGDRVVAQLRRQVDLQEVVAPGEGDRRKAERQGKAGRVSSSPADSLEVFIVCLIL